MPHNRSWLITGYVLSAVGAMLFATKGILIKLIYAQDVGVLSLLALRMLLSTPVFAAVGFAEWRRRPADRRPDAKTLASAALVGIIGYHLSSWLDFEGLALIDAQSERLILFTYPFMVILFGRLIFGHRLALHAVAGAALSYAGIAAMFGGAPARTTDLALTGAALVFAAATSFALYQLFARELILKCGAALFIGVAMSGAGLSLLIQFFLTHDVAELAIPSAAWPLVLTLAVFATVVPAFMMAAGTARVGAQGNAIIGTLSPTVTVVLAVLILDEPFGWPEALGTLLVLIGVGLFTLVDARRRQAPAVSAAPLPSPGSSPPAR